MVINVQPGDIIPEILGVHTVKIVLHQWFTAMARYMPLKNSPKSTMCIVSKKVVFVDFYIPSSNKKFKKLISLTLFQY